MRRAPDSRRGGRPDARLGAVCLVASLLLVAGGGTARAAMEISYDGTIRAEEPETVATRAPIVAERLYRVCQDEKIPCEYVAVADREGKPLVTGIRFQAAADTDWIRLAANADGVFSGLISTHILGPLGHVYVVGVLDELRRDVPDLKVNDRTGYWVDRDSKRLRELFETARMAQPKTAEQPAGRRAEEDNRGRIGGAVGAVAVIGLGLYLVIMAFRGSRG